MCFVFLYISWPSCRICKISLSEVRSCFVLLTPRQCQQQQPQSQQLQPQQQQRPQRPRQPVHWQLQWIKSYWPMSANVRRKNTLSGGNSWWGCKYMMSNQHKNRKYAMIKKKIQHIKVCKCALLRSNEKCDIVILKKKKLQKKLSWVKSRRPQRP